MNRLTSLCGSALLAAAAWAPLPSHAVELLNEGFNNVSGLPGWTQYNASVPPGNGWFQGNSGIFSAQDGAANSYAAANYLGAAGGTGSVDNWLITPTLALGGLTTLSFWVNRAGEPGFSDQIEVRFGAGSTGTGVGTFDMLLGTISGASFPAQWQQWSANLSFVGDGRFAFRYLGDAATLDYVGLDSVNVVTAVPEPSSYLMLLAGLGAVGVSARRLRKQAGK
ncbi:choice-of-anchor J family PEP-CTERM protein [Massilia yuzhufengensis]|uniref:PEP-CTERM protein-sorting domain-containing protein n=1 Tax=Massilia yuzhufengensis TaxID=1164594 RepID=A0A1I1EUX2_9BURK|nr:choice-of-anchor J domain-containing protein [Massilia yuzhufengensis]SFB90969.1 PEP-CTERM protein-sorting domain-containing protein [Massilia yuzhufengensis]